MQQDNSNKTLKIVAIVLVVIALVLGGAAIAYAILGDQEQSTSTEAASTVPETQPVADDHEGFTRIETTRTDGAPNLELWYPDDYKVKTDFIDKTHPLYKEKPGGEAITMNLRDDVYISLRYQADSYRYSLDDWTPIATVTKVADADFDSQGGATLGLTDEGPFIVAEVVCPSALSSSQNEKSHFLALLPASFEGQHPVKIIQETCYMSFQYAGQEVWFYAESDSLTAEQREQVIKTLASLQVVSK